ncbi:MAG TPA: YlxM family DNA-binding protein [Bacillota bacterium]|nr:YlxM family DNA-binding protein [Bacillota bacterium]
MLERLNRVNLLSDIYGPLLTGRQRQVLDLYYRDDLSLGEIAAEFGISRQAVYDLIRRAVGTLEELEQKLGLWQYFKFQQERLVEAESILKKQELEAGDRRRLQELVHELLQKL